MESLCTVCNETNTKYTCITCEVFVCNKCAKAAGENVDGYNEELKRVGKCPDCDTDFTKTVPDCAITESVQAMQPPKTKKVQKSVYDMFGKSAQNTLKESLPKKSEESLPSLPRTKINPKQHKAPLTVSWTVTPATVDKCKAELASHSVSEWLTYDIDKDGKVKDMKCKFCITYENDIKNLTLLTFLQSVLRIIKSLLLKIMLQKVNIIWKHATCISSLREYLLMICQRLCPRQFQKITI